MASFWPLRPGYGGRLFAASQPLLLISLRLACLISLNSPPDPQRGYQIFQRATDAFEDGYIASGGSAGFLSRGNLVQISDDLRTVDRAALERHKQVACLGERAIIGIHHDTGAAHGFIVDLARMRLKSSYQVQVRARLKPSSIKQGFDRGG